MKGKMKFEKIIIFLCIIGLVVTVTLAFFGKPQGSFTELYFNEHTELPSLIDYTTPFVASQEGPFLIVPNVTGGWKELGEEAYMMISSQSLNFADLNRNYNISFTVASNEAKKTKYFYNVTSSLLNETGEFELIPKENITINLTVMPTKSEWKLNSTKSEHWHDILDITDDSWLAGGGGETTFDTIVNAESLRDLPLSHNVDLFGQILQTKLSFDELSRKPYTKRYEYSKIENDEKVYTITDISLAAAGNKLVADINKTEIKYISKIQKFEVMLIKNLDTPQEEEQSIHFWYQIRQIGTEND